MEIASYGFEMPQSLMCSAKCYEFIDVFVLFVKDFDNNSYNIYVEDTLLSMVDACGCVALVVPSPCPPQLERVRGCAMSHSDICVASEELKGLTCSLVYAALTSQKRGNHNFS